MTHNANLVINTDANQIIVALAGRQRADDLPQIAYQSGSPKDDGVRKQVCEILEGGEHACRERARRLLVREERWPGD